MTQPHLMRSSKPLNFDIAAGSVQGYPHVQRGQNNQDAFAWTQGEQGAIAVVCDGCGSGRASEVGAKLGARLVLNAIAQHLAAIEDHGDRSLDDDDWHHIQQQVLTALDAVATAMGQSRAEIVRTYFLFTVMVAVVGPQTTVVAGLGDGIFAINDKVHQLGPFAQNAPPYLGYRLLLGPNSSNELGPAHRTDDDDPDREEQEPIAPFTAAALQLKPHWQGPTAQVQSLLIGSDGVADLRAIAPQALPGKAESVGPLSQFWQQDRYFLNPDMVRRRLAVINRSHIHPDWHHRRIQRSRGLLPDDTTLVVMRRRSPDATPYPS